LYFKEAEAEVPAGDEREPFRTIIPPGERVPPVPKEHPRLRVSASEGVPKPADGVRPDHDTGEHGESRESGESMEQGEPAEPAEGEGSDLNLDEPQPPLNGWIWPVPSKTMSDEERDALIDEYTRKAVETYPDSVEALSKYGINKAHIFRSKIFFSKQTAASAIREYNFALDPSNIEPEHIKERIVQLYRDKVEPYANFIHKIDIWLGGMLEHFSEEGEVQSASYFYPNSNTTIFNEVDEERGRMPTIHKRGGGIREVEEKVREADLGLSMNRNRPDTKTKLLFFSNVTFKIYRCGSSMVGACEEEGEEDDELSPPFIAPLPQAIRNSKLTMDPKSSRGMNDCFWRSLAYGLGRRKNLKSCSGESIRLVNEFVKWRKENLKISVPTAMSFLENGIDILSKFKFNEKKDHFKFKCDVSSVLAQIENCFNINIYVYSYDMDSLKLLEKKYHPRKPSSDQIRKMACLQPFFVSCGKHGGKKVHVLLDGIEGETSKLHCYVIKRIDGFVSRFKCSYCERFFRHRGTCNCHMASGSCLSRFTYPGGVFQRQKSIWEKLGDHCVDFSDVLKRGEVFPRWDHRITWDIEAMSVPCKMGEESANTQVLSKFRACSISVSSNVPGYEGSKFFYERNNPRKLFHDAYEFMKEVQCESEKLWHEKMSPVYAKIEKKIIKMSGSVKVPIHRFQVMSKRLKKRLKWNSFKGRSEEELAKKSDETVTEFHKQDLPTREPWLKDKIENRGSVIIRSPSDIAKLGTFPPRDSSSPDIETDYDSDDESFIDDEEQEGVEMHPSHVKYNLNKFAQRQRRTFNDTGNHEAEDNDRPIPANKKDETTKSLRDKYVRVLSRLLYEVKRYGALLPVVGFNSSEYDLGVLAAFWPEEMGLLKESPKPEKHIENEVPLMKTNKRGKEYRNPKYKVFMVNEDMVNFKPHPIASAFKYKSIVTMHGLNFLDLKNYAPPKCSLDGLVKNYKLEDKKGFFPYSILSRDDFEHIQLWETVEKKVKNTEAFESTVGVDTLHEPDKLYNMFNDKLKKMIHRVEGNTLEGEWQRYTAGHHSRTTQPVICQLAEKFAKDEAELEACEHDTEAIESLKVDWREFLGYHSVTFQKQRTVDLEDYMTLKSGGNSQMTSYGWCNGQSDLGFKSRLNKPTTGVENFDKGVRNVIVSNKFSTLEYLEWYNNKDVEIMHPLIDHMTELFREVDNHIEMFRDNVSVPNIARCAGHRDAEKHGGTYFLAKGHHQGDYFERPIRRNLNGGPSIIFNKNPVAYKSKTLGGQTIKTVLTLDAAALYPYSMKKWLPVGYSVHVYGPDDSEGEPESGKPWVYRELGKCQDSLGQHIWLESLSSELKMEANEEKRKYEEAGKTYPDPEKLSEVLHKKKINKDIRIGPYLVDGVRYRNQFLDHELLKYRKKVKGVVYEFLGDWYHGRPNLIKKSRSEGKNRSCKLLEERFQSTVKKIKHLVGLGFVVHAVWEGDFKSQHFMDVNDYRKSYLPPFTNKFLFGHAGRKGDRKDYQASELTTLSDPEKFTEFLFEAFDDESDYEKSVLAMEDGEDSPLAPTMLAEVDIQPRDPEAAENVKHFGPVFVNGLREGEKSGHLRGVQCVEKAIFTAAELQILCSRLVGMKITKVHRVWEFAAAKCFKPFIDKAVEKRKEGDLPNGNSMLASMFKLVPNSLYGGLIQNKDKHCVTSFLNNEWEVCQEINKPTFKEAREIDEEIKQVDSTKNKVKQNIPIQLGKFILSYAKVHMIAFYFHVIKRFCNTDKIDLVSMDTDSFTLALSENSLDDCVYPYAREEWERDVKPVWFVHEGCSSECSSSLTALDKCNKRIPGPFKEEFRGDKAVCLSSKLFTVSSFTPGIKPKVASKGLMDRSLHYDEVEHFESTLYHNEKFRVPFTSIQRKGDTMNLLCTARCVSNAYSKRRHDENDPNRTYTWEDCFNCGTPLKKRKLRHEREGIIRKKIEAKRSKCKKNAIALPFSNANQEDSNGSTLSRLDPPSEEEMREIEARAKINSSRLKALQVRSQKTAERERKILEMKRAEQEKNTVRFLPERDIFGDLITENIAKNIVLREKTKMKHSVPYFH